MKDSWLNDIIDGLCVAVFLALIIFLAVCMEAFK